MNNPRIAELVRKAQTGDGDALNELVSECYSDIYYYILKTVKKEDLAADVTQETFLKIITSLDQLREPVTFPLWARKIAYSMCAMHFRAMNSQNANEFVCEENEDGETLLDRLPDESENALPEKVLEDKEFRQTIMDMINSLPSEQTNALLLYYYEKLSVKEIAEIQDTTEGTVKSRLNYARKAIRTKVEDYEEKTGTKLHSAAILPLLLRFIFGGEKAAMPALSVPASLTAGATTTATTGASSVTAATATAKTAGTALTVKIAAIVTAAALVVAGAGFGIAKLVEKDSVGESDSGTRKKHTESQSVETDDRSDLWDWNYPDDDEEDDNEQDTTTVAPPDEEDETSVTFRLVLLNPMKYANCSVFLRRYETAESEEPIDEIIFGIGRAGNWQFTRSLEPGYYAVALVSIEGNWQEDISGHSERFEVKGGQMTVYVAVEDPDKPVKMPENWLVYGKDTQNFGIWAESE